VTAGQRKIAQAIRDLRGHLQESQQAFSNRLDVSVRTVARYEIDRPPRGIMLLRLAEIAEKAERHDLGRVFKDSEEIENASRKSPFAGAIRALRAALGDTQQQLAARADVALPTIALAETSGFPGEVVLGKLRQVAKDHNLPEIEAALEWREFPEVAEERTFQLELEASRREVRESATIIRDRAFDVLESFVAVDNEEDRIVVGGAEIAPQLLIIVNWLLSRVNDEERLNLEVLLLDIAIKVVQRLCSDPKSSVDAERAKGFLNLALASLELTSAAKRPLSTHPKEISD
jgi:transcriptional regulator with XRE-family HTH domain